ncbi:hypothetical protein TNCV_3735461 [Trichonephila clavipes]|nr:hypothetical protein TNCV_3735461 [Trichonephila clavipes]
MALMDRVATSRFQDSKCLHEQFDVVCSSKDSQLGDHHQDGRIRVWRHRGEYTLEPCIRHRHIAPSPGMMA